MLLFADAEFGCASVARKSEEEAATPPPDAEDAEAAAPLLTLMECTPAKLLRVLSRDNAAGGAGDTERGGSGEPGAVMLPPPPPADGDLPLAASCANDHPPLEFERWRNDPRPNEAGDSRCELEPSEGEGACDDGAADVDAAAASALAMDRLL